MIKGISSIFKPDMKISWDYQLVNKIARDLDKSRSIDFLVAPTVKKIDLGRDGNRQIKNQQDVKREISRIKDILKVLN
jgi:hypothetical protein